MLKYWFFPIFLVIFATKLDAQLPDGSQAPDFTVTDVNGQTHTLSEYLDDGKTVFLKFFATWCGFCWNHHETNALNDLYEQYGPPGTGEVMVILIEGDSRTNEGCITDSGCNANTYGDWTAGKTNPIADDASVKSLYRVGYYPTIYGICPDGILYEVGQKTSSWYYNWHLDNCALKLELNEISDASCYEKSDGEIIVSASGGKGNYTYDWSNGITINENRNIPAGTYTVTVSDGASSVEGGPYSIGQPEQLRFRKLEVEDASCVKAADGAIELDVEGGTGLYSYEWEDGVSTRLRSDLVPGSYAVTVSDENDCLLASGDISVSEKPLPNPETSNDTSICMSGSAQLSVANGVEYLWSDGSSDPSIDVSPTSTSAYGVTVTYETGCEATDSILVTVFDNPDLGTDRSFEMGCSDEFIVLSPENLPGPDHEYIWEVLDGGQLGSSPNPWELVVGEIGLYSLTAVSPFLSCSSSVHMEVLPDESFPVAEIQSLGELDCVNNEIQLDGTASSQGNNFSFSWSAENPDSEIGNAQSLQPTINSPGIYRLTVRNDEADCENTKSIEIEYGNLRRPDVSIGFEMNGGDIRFYNASRDAAERYYWILPGDNTSIEASPIVDMNALPGDIIEVCLNATNQCGNSSLICQTIDLSDDSHYFSGSLKDQFGEPLSNVEIVSSNAETVLSSSSGEYLLNGLDKGQNFELHAVFPADYQENDINAADLDVLWQGLLNDQTWTDREILTGDINGDGRISIVDAIVLQKELLGGQLDRAAQWMSFTERCLETQGKEAVNNCPGFFDVYLLQSSRLNNNFVAVQKADLDTDNNLLEGNASRRYSFDGQAISHDMKGWQVLAMKIDDVPTELNQIFCDGEVLKPDEYRLENGELFILKLMKEKKDKVRIIFGRESALEKAVEMQLYPNPATNRINVTFYSDRSANGSWSITDMAGVERINSRKNWNKGSNVWTIPTDNLNSGVFFLNVENEGEIYRKKFVVSKN